VKVLDEKSMQLDISVKVDDRGGALSKKFTKERANSFARVNSLWGTNTLSSKGCILSEEDNEHGASFKVVGGDGNILIG